MSKFDVQEIQSLAEIGEGPHISFYMPVVQAGPQTRQNPIRFKNLLDQAENTLRQKGHSPEEIQSLLEPAENLHNDHIFWQHQARGLVVLIDQTGMRTYDLPREVSETVRVSDQFYLTPLLQFLFEGGDFYILALNQGHTRLYKATPHSIEEVNLHEDIPTSLAQALRYDDPQRQLQWHTSTREPGGLPGERPARFHGQGGSDQQNDKTNILRYFQQLDKGITDFLKDRQSPLVITGVEFLLPIYQQANHYPHLVKQGIPQQPQSLSEKELHQQAWKIVKPIFEESRHKVSQRYQLLKGRNEKVATDDLKTVVKAAPFGRIEVLLVDKNAQKWGKFDRQKSTVEFSDEKEAGSRDLIEFSALETLRNGGTVYAVDPEELPDKAETVAAILRY